MVPNASNPELLENLQDATVFALASHEEGLGLVYLEALACGVPVVATATEGAEEIFRNGDAGRLTPLLPDGEDEFAQALFDASNSSTTAREGLRDLVLRNFGNDVALRRFTQVYDELLGLDVLASPPEARSTR